MSLIPAAKADGTVQLIQLKDSSLTNTAYTMVKKHLLENIISEVVSAINEFTLSEA